MLCLCTSAAFATEKQAVKGAAMQQRINIITLGVKDLKLSRNFYEKGLGWKASPISDNYDGIVFYQAGGCVVSLFPRDELAKDALISPDGQGFRGFTLAHNVHDKDEVDRVLTAALDAGAAITKPAAETSWGGYSGYFSDPDGYLWEVAWNPFLELDPEGNLRLP